MILWSPTEALYSPMLLGLQKAVNASRDPYTGTDIVKWKLVKRTWSNIALDQYCIDPQNRISGDPISPECPDVINLGTTQVCVRRVDKIWMEQTSVEVGAESITFRFSASRSLGK